MDCVDTLLSWCLYFAVFAGAFYALVYQFWVGVCLTVPALLGDVIMRRTHKRAAFMVKLLLLFQTVMMWTILPWATFHSFDTAEMAPRVINIIHQTQDSIPIGREMITGGLKNWIPKLGVPSFFTSESTEEIVENVFGNLSTTNFPDLKYRTPEEVRRKHAKVFAALPARGFEPGIRNPCWFHNESMEQKANARGHGRRPTHPRAEGDKVLSCLPYVYLLGQPKSGTSDLYERLVAHPDVVSPDRKEIRWFTRGEFTTERMPKAQMLSEDTSLYSFTSAFDEAAVEIRYRYEHQMHPQAITVDGGPHTLWWPTQSPDGTLLPEEIPAPQIIREMQPNAKFLITLSDPVNRMYSDYYFLDDSLKPVETVNRQQRKKSQDVHEKSPKEFHLRAEKQVSEFKACVRQIEGKESTLGWFRASQICAHDRKRFGVGGWGRLNIGLYVTFIEKWLEHFSLNQFHVVRLEDFHADPQGYMNGVLSFLDLRLDVDTTEMLTNKVHNKHRSSRPDMLPGTEKLLREFYQPYNDLLAKLLKSEAFRWLPQGSPAEAEKDASKFSDRKPRGPNAHKVVQPGVEPGLRGSNPLDPRNIAARLVGRHESGQKTAPREPEKWKEFSLDGLVLPDPGAEMNRMATRYVDLNKKPKEGDDEAEQLCVSVFAMDLLAVKTLLVDHRVPGNVIMSKEYGRNAFHCLSVLNLNVDGHTKSHVFHLLKGEKGYLTDILDPPLDLHMDSTIGLEVIKSMEPMVLKIGAWLLRAGADINLADSNGVTPLIFASVAGSDALIQFLLDNGADVNARSIKDFRSPAHYAAAYGHMTVLKKLIDKGADLDAEDFVGVTPRQIIESSGPIFPDDVENVLHMKQDTVRNLERPMFPTYDSFADSKFNNTPRGAGGFDATRLKGYENAMHCDADQYNAGEITGKEIYEKYLARSRPVLIRGLIDDWKAREEFKREMMLQHHGNLLVTVTSIPYAEKFHGEGTTKMTLRDYMDTVQNKTVVGGSHPWYVFIGHPLKQKRGKSKLRGADRDVTSLGFPSEDPMGRAADMVHTHLVDYENVPTPDVIHEAVQLVSQGPTSPLTSNPRERREYVNAQWAYGGAGTGAPVHYHNTAWNALVYGAKYWVMYPPHTLVMSNKHILQFIEEDLKPFEAKGHKPLTCVQTAGDVMIVPESWSHGVLNIQESVAVATEMEQFHWRFKPGSRVILDAMPSDRSH